MPPPMGMRGGGLGGKSGNLGLPSSSYNRRASTCSGGSMFGPPMPPPYKKRSIPNMNKRGSTASGSGLYGLVIPPKVKEGEKVSNKSERRQSLATNSKNMKIGNSHTSVIDSTASLYSGDDERRSSSRLGQLLPLIDEQHLISESESHDLLSRNTVVRIAPHNPSKDDSQDDEKTDEGDEDDDDNPDVESEAISSKCCGRTRPSSWFHLYLCFGMIGFIVFWSVLMLRIYLPESYWTWSYIW